MGEVFPAPHERERIKACLADLSETSAAFRQMSNAALEALAQALGPRLKPTLDAFQQASYELSEQGYAANELEDSWAQVIGLHAPRERRPSEHSASEWHLIGTRKGGVVGTDPCFCAMCNRRRF